MIISFNCKNTEQLFNDHVVSCFRNIEKMARRKLMILNAAYHIQDLKIPPGNRLETLKGDRKGQYSIRINNQWRICFVWHNNNAHNVEIIDYH